MPSADARSRTDSALNAAEDAVRASIEAASRIARESLDAGTEAARKVQSSLKEALDAVASGHDGKPGSRTRQS